MDKCTADINRQSESVITNGQMYSSMLTCAAIISENDCRTNVKTLIT